jgi:ABC-type transport system involved in multi-copper enzyme maturation permease subunit
MNVAAVLERELRVTARQPFTYWARLMAVGALLAAVAVYAAQGGLRLSSGGQLFGYLHCALLLAIWTVVPFLAADCISSEKRQGTLALLFLTPLSARDIVVSKGIAHGLRAVGLWVAAIPALAIPLMAGGVSWREVVLSVLVNFSSLCLAVSAGLAASAGSRLRTRAVVASVCLTVCLALAWMIALGVAVLGLARFSPLPDPLRVKYMLASGFLLSTNWGECWRLNSPRAPSASTVLWDFGGMAAVSLLLLFLTVVFAARRVKGCRRDTGPSAFAQWLNRAFCTPMFFRNTFQQWMRWELGHNPIGWLERRTWSGRLVSWSWFGTAVIVSTYSTLIVSFQPYDQSLRNIEGAIAYLLIGSIAATAAGSFRRERESGVLELLLVAPLRESQIIGGRLRGLWTQFMPAILILLAVWAYCGSLAGGANRSTGLRPPPVVYWTYRGIRPAPSYGMGVSLLPWLSSSLVSYTVMFLIIPVIGLYYSLAQTSFLSAFIRTLFVGVFLPFALVLPLRVAELSALNWTHPAPDLSALISIIRLALAASFARRLHQSLKYRKFALTSGGA